MYAVDSLQSTYEDVSFQYYCLLALAEFAGVVYCVLFEHLSVGLLLGDSLCEIIICHYDKYFRMYHFNVVHALYVMSDSISCNILYLILKSIK